MILSEALRDDCVVVVNSASERTAAVPAHGFRMAVRRLGIQTAVGAHETATQALNKFVLGNIEADHDDRPLPLEQFVKRQRLSYGARKTVEHTSGRGVGST
jgi:hypothetical protein